MAIIKGAYRVLNNQGTYDEVYFKTDASQVIESDSKKFVSATEKSNWNNKSDANHKHTSNDISDATSSNTANVIVKRDSSGDIVCRTTRNEYADQSTISGAMAFRVAGGTGTDNHLRFCSNTSAIRTYLGVYGTSQTYSRTEMDTRYRQKSDLVFTDTISITTPVA